MKQLEEQQRFAVLADVDSATKVLRWDGGVWHRPSRWRGLRPGEGIPDDMRVARTLCGVFIPRGFEQTKSAFEGDVCDACEREAERAAKAR